MTAPRAAELASRPRYCPALVKSNKIHHATFLLLASLALFLALTLEVRGHQRVVIPYVDMPVPTLCTYKRLLGHDCPGCGLTRSFISLGNGQVAAAWSYNPAGLVLFAVVVFQVPYRTIQIWRLSHGKLELRWSRSTWILWSLVVVLIGQWLARWAGHLIPAAS